MKETQLGGVTQTSFLLEEGRKHYFVRRLPASQACPSDRASMKIRC